MARGRPSKKGLIAEAASNLFRVSGYQGTSIDQVVIEAGVSKPTVYSNFPSKLLLWQEVLMLLIAETERELDAKATALKVSETSFTKGWMALWEQWVASADRIAAYRIHWGERHKLTDVEHGLFHSLEELLVAHLSAWLNAFELSNANFYALVAVSREAYLIPALSKASALPIDVESEISALIK